VGAGVVGFEGAFEEVEGGRGVAGAAGVEVVLAEEFVGDAVEVLGGVGCLEVAAER
jgi:hypothetical protein